MTLLGILVGIAVLLTCTMFITRQMMLGLPSAMFWAITGGQCYIVSTAFWDIYYLTFFASFGMAIFCMYAMYALHDKDLSGPDADEGEFFDEKREPDLRGNVEKGKEAGYIDEHQPGRHARNVRERADRRRSGGVQRKKPNWGEFK